MSEEFNFERESEFMSERMFTLCDEEDVGLAWIPLDRFTDKQRQQIEEELYELSKDNVDTGSPTQIAWDYPLEKSIAYYNKGLAPKYQLKQEEDK
tara:strand:+ start:279 stop:563 length:285 start_codon:yes stop_codon:yes gene_type:complete